MTAAGAATEPRDFEDRLVAGFAALAVSIHLLEAAVPMPLPGVKPGLANVIVLIVLLRYGIRLAAAVTLLRVIAGSIFTGSFLAPAFLLSLAGALSALAVAALLHLAVRRWTGPLGFSVAMAMAHMAGQFLIAWWLFVPHPGLVGLLPVLLAAALGLGAVTGIIAASVMQRLPPAAGVCQPRASSAA